MSMFFKALEQAERDRNGHQRPRPAETVQQPVATASAAVDTLPPPSPAPSGERVDGAAGPTAPVTRRVDRAPEPPHAAAPAVERPPVPVEVRPPAPRESAGREPARELPVVSPSGLDAHLVSLVEPASFAAEQYRALRHTVEQLHRTSGQSVFAIGSPSAGDGKTTTAINLAGALAQSSDARVLLVEADLRCPRVAERLGLGSGPMPGLVQAIQTPELGLDDVARRIAGHNLAVGVAGDCPTSPYEVLESPRLGELLEEAQCRYDYVVIDTPPIVSFPDCRLIGQWVDGWLVVVAAHRTSRKLLEEALDLMHEPKTVGFVFTHDERFRAGGRYYGAYGARGKGLRGRER